jgi:hypothetical protein
MMSGTMATKGRKPGKGVDDNKLADALRRAEEAVLRDGKERDEEAKKEKEPKSSPPVELDDSHFAKKQPEPQPEKKPEKKASKGLDLDSVLFGDKPKKKPAAKPAATPAAKPAEPPKQQPAPPMVDLSKKEEPAPKKPAAPAKKLPDRPPPNLGFGELDLGGGSAESSEMELSAMSEDPIERPTAPTPAPAEAPTAPPPVERAADSRLPMRDPSKEYVPYVPKRSYGRLPAGRADSRRHRRRGLRLHKVAGERRGRRGGREGQDRELQPRLADGRHLQEGKIQIAKRLG